MAASIRPVEASMRSGPAGNAALLHKPAPDVADEPRRRNSNAAEESGISPNHTVTWADGAGAPRCSTRATTG